jgi:predicted ATPase
VFLIGGEAGAGKTRLVGELVMRAQETGAAGLVGGCLDVEEGRLPFAPFIEALRPHVRGLDQAARIELFDTGSEELGRFLPELAAEPEETPEASGVLAQGRLFELVLWLLGRLADPAPLVLALEDLHWSDRSARDLLAFLVRNLRTERVLLVATYRSDELHRGHPLRPFLAELERGRRVKRLDLRPFNREEIREQLAGILGAAADASLVDSVFERSEGNAFFAEELLVAHNHGQELSPTLRDVLLARVERRSAGAQELLRLVAVGGRLVSDRLLAVVSSLSEADRLESLREAIVHRLLVAEETGGYRFRHALLREAVYEEMLPEARARVHAAYGAALNAQPGLAFGERTLAGDLARHWFGAHDLPRALAATVRAGESAQSRSGFAEARTNYERALELWNQVPDPETTVGLDRVTVIRRAAEVANLAGDHGRAATLIRAALRHVDAAREPAAAGVLHERLGRFLWASGDSEAALLAYEEAVRLVPDTPPSAARARVLAANGQGLMLLARYQESRASCDDAIAIAGRVGARAVEGTRSTRSGARSPTSAIPRPRSRTFSGRDGSPSKSATSTI